MKSAGGRSNARRIDSMSNFVLVAETGADIPADLIEHYQIRIVPMHVSLGAGAQDDMTFPVEDIFGFYSRTGILPTTSGCNPNDFVEVFDEIHRQFPEKHIIHLAYSAVTTCSFQSAVIAARDRDYVTSIDTKSVSAGQAMVVLRVAQFLKDNPDCTLEAVKAETNKLISSIHMGFLPGDLEYLRAGGRVSNAAYLGATILRLKPLIEIDDGRLMASKKYHGKIASITPKFIQEYAKKHHLQKSQVALIYSSGLDEAIKEEANQVLHSIGFQKILRIKTGCVISTHCGPGGFGLAGFSEE
jgi:DegV family protein with EDD domain